MSVIVSQPSPIGSYGPPPDTFDASSPIHQGSVVSPQRVTLHEDRPSSVSRTSRRSLYRVKSFATGASSALGRQFSRHSEGGEDEEDEEESRQPETPQARAMRAAVSSIALTVELLRLTLGGGLISLEVSAAGGPSDLAGLCLFTIAFTFSASSASALAAGIGQPHASQHPRAALRFAAKFFFFLSFISVLELIALIVISATEHEGYWQYYTSSTSSSASLASGLKSLLPLAWPLAVLAFFARLEVAVIAWRGQVLFLTLDDEDNTSSFRFRDSSKRISEPVGGYAKRTMSAATRPSEASVLRGSQPFRSHVSIAESIQPSEASQASFPISNFSPLPQPDSGYGMTLPAPTPARFHFNNMQPQSPGFGKVDDTGDYGHVKSSMKLNNMSHAQLNADERLRLAFEKKVKEAIIKESGHALSEDHVHLALRPGSVIIDATITPPPGVSHHNVHSKLEGSSSLSQTVLDHVHQVDGIDRVKEGAVHISDVSHSKHTYVSPLTTSAEMDMSGPLSPQSPAGSFYGAARRHNVHERCATGASALLSVKQLETSFREELRRQKEEWQKALADLRATHTRLAESHSERIDDAMRQARMPRPPALSSTELRAHVDGSTHSPAQNASTSVHQWGPSQDESLRQRAEGQKASQGGGLEDYSGSESLAAKVAQRVAYAALRAGEGGGVEGRLRTLQREVQSLAAELLEARSSAQSLRDRRIEREGGRLHHDLVEALVLPVDERSSAQRLALRLLRQATEVSALVLAGAQASSRPSSDLVEELRIKYRSMRELREVFKQIMADRVQHVLGKSGRAAQAAVSSAIRGSDSRGRPFGRNPSEGRDIIALGGSMRSGSGGEESPPLQEQALSGTLPAAPEAEFGIGLAPPSATVFRSAASAANRGRSPQRDDAVGPHLSPSPALSFVPSEASLPFKIRPEHQRQEELGRSISPTRIWSSENTLEQQQQGLLGEAHQDQRSRGNQQRSAPRERVPSPQPSLQQQHQRQPQPVFPSQGPRSYDYSDSSDSTSREADHNNGNYTNSNSNSNNSKDEDMTTSLRRSPERAIPNEWGWRSQLPQPSQVIQMVGAAEGGRTAPPRLLSAQQQKNLNLNLTLKSPPHRQRPPPAEQEQENNDHLWQQQQQQQQPRHLHPYSPGATLPFDAAGW